MELVYPTAAQVSAEEARLKAEEARLEAEQEAAMVQLEAEQGKELDSWFHKLFDLVCRDGSGTICKDEFEVFAEHMFVYVSNVEHNPKEAKRVETPQSLMDEEVRQLHHTAASTGSTAVLQGAVIDKGEFTQFMREVTHHSLDMAVPLTNTFDEVSHIQRSHTAARKDN